MIAKYVSGFKLFMYFDHKNIERAEIVLRTRRASKKLLNWVADSQELLANVVRVWIDGKLNVLPDVGSRLPWESAVSKHLPVPHGPLIDFIRKLFTSPDELANDVARTYRESGVGSWNGQSQTAPRGYAGGSAAPAEVFEGPVPATGPVDVEMK